MSAKRGAVIILLTSSLPLAELETMALILIESECVCSFPPSFPIDSGISFYPMQINVSWDYTLAQSSFSWKQFIGFKDNQSSPLRVCLQPRLQEKFIYWEKRTDGFLSQLRLASMQMHCCRVIDLRGERENLAKLRSINKTHLSSPPTGPATSTCAANATVYRRIWPKQMHEPNF